MPSRNRLAVWFWLLAGAPACAFTPDGALDEAEPGACDDWGFLPVELGACALPPPSSREPLELATGDWILDGATGVLARGDEQHALAHADLAGISVISVHGLTVGPSATLRGVGAEPLAVVSWTTMTILGAVDVGSSRAGGPGAGADAPACGDGAQRGVLADPGDGGGGGGGFAGAGGDGGTGGGATGVGGAGGTGRSRPVRLEGGCAGASAALGTDGAPGGAGQGGGAILLVAKDELVVAGVITAGGAGGGGGVHGRTGGGGGGSGGMVALESDRLRITTTAVLAANGGQGGGGCDNGAAAAGVDGRPGALEAPTNKEGRGGNGGRGGSIAVTDGADATDVDRGGGGGGGSVGYVVYQGHVVEDVAHRLQ